MASDGAEAPVSVLVEAAAGLAAQPPGLDVAAQQRAGPVLVVPEPVVQHLHDRQAGVQADQVGQRQRPHRVVHAQPHYGVDRLAVAHALHQAVDRLVDHRHQDSVGDEPGVVVRLSHRLAHRLGCGHHAGHRLVAGLEAADHLHQLHQRHRVHEVHADHLLRALGGRGQAGDRDRAGVGGEDGAVPGHLVQLGEDAQLQLDVLGRSLDQEVGVGRLGRRLDPLERGVARRLVQAALLGQLRERRLDAGYGLLQLVRRHVAEGDFEAADGCCLGDARPHLARSHHGDPPDLAHAGNPSISIASPWAAPEQIAASPMPPPRRRSWCTSVPTRRAPEAPMGCPKATAPPCTLKRSESAPSRSMVDSTTEQKASLISNRSTSATVMPARSSAIRAAAAGVRTRYGYSSATWPSLRIRASGVNPCAAAQSSEASTSAAAPSFTPGAFPAVVAPSLLNTGFSAASRSAEVSRRGPSSVSTTVSPLRPGTVTSTISSARCPASWAATARWWLRSAQASWSSREHAISADTTEFSSAMIRWVKVEVRPSLVIWSTSTPSPIVYPKRALGTR